MEKLIVRLYEKHNDWISIVESFGCKKEDVEDIVQDMYLKIITHLQNGKDISYGEDINHFYIFRTLTTIFLDYKRKEGRVTFVPLDDIDLDIEQDMDYETIKEEVDKYLDELFWYDKQVFDIINSGESISELSRKTTISYYSLYNTYRKVKDKIKAILWEIGLKE